MVIKKYIVSNMNEALTRIRHELGKDAVIISQRKIRKPGIKGFFSDKQIEVTAAAENSSKEVNNKKSDEDFNDSLKDLKRIMENEIKSKQKVEVSEEKVHIAAEVNPLEEEVKEMKELLNKVIKNTTKEEVDEVDELLEMIKDIDIDMEFYEDLKAKVGEENIEENLKRIIGEEIQISLDELSGNVVLVGPTGVGKTTTIAKLAGRLSLIEKKKVGLITVDTYRIGAVEQLKTYAEIMNIPFKVVITIKEMEEAVNAMKDCDIVLIDTTGRSSKNTMQISELRAFVEKAKPDCVNVVISATTKNKDIKTILEGYKELDYNQVIITKLDETTTYGALYNIQRRADKPLKYITTGQNVPDDIKVPTKEEVLRFIFGEETLC
ncbi:flagellar biosynthesis protein FlhF [Clostridium paraputrificum]|uniref:flagellar biosynthesis protein FlhF n=1 Tax=Clostridium paraputrificum TaxID=29363 RepID=UPI003D33BE64